MTAHPDPEATTGVAQRLEAGRAVGMRQPRWPVEWQPIETAPLDGTVIDLWFPEAVREDGYILKARRHASCRWGGWEEWEKEWADLDGGFCTMERQDPSHWMPPPEPPSTPNGGEP